MQLAFVTIVYDGAADEVLLDAACACTADGANATNNASIVAAIVDELERVVGMVAVCAAIKPDTLAGSARSVYMQVAAQTRPSW